MTKEEKAVYDRAYHQKNKARKNAQARAWYDVNFSTQVRERHLKKSFGIGVVEFEAMLTAQGGKCAICGTTNPKGRGAFHVDHDHVTNKIRGLLCHSCNSGIGALRDDPALLDKAAAYLRSTV